MKRVSAADLITGLFFGGVIIATVLFFSENRGSGFSSLILFVSLVLIIGGYYLHRFSEERKIIHGQGTPSLSQQEEQSESGSQGAQTVPALVQIPDHKWDRAAVELWNKGHSCREIAEKIGDVSDKRVRNRLTELRQKHGERIVPKDEDREKKLG